MSSSSSSRKRKYSSRVSLFNLPDDLLWNCLARVSRLYYPTLFLVSKRFRSVLTSKELYETRKLLGRTQSCLYMCLRVDTEINPRWFTLWPKPTRIPNPNPNPNESSDNVMVSISTRNNSPMNLHDLIVFGSYIYKIGGVFNEPPYEVLFMDCRSHTWHEAPPMQMDRNSSHMSVLDGKIYVSGSDYNSANLVGCFDPETQTWEHLPSLNEHMFWPCSRLEIFDMEGKLYVEGDDKNLVYNPKENRWDPVDLHGYWITKTSFCVIDNVSYRYGSSIKWYNYEERSWRDLKGLEGEVLPQLAKRYGKVKLVDYGGKLAVLWVEDATRSNTIGSKKIWCAEIALERRNKDEIYGKVLWCNDVFRSPNSSFNWECLVVTV